MSKKGAGGRILTQKEGIKESGIFFAMRPQHSHQPLDVYEGYLRGIWDSCEDIQCTVANCCEYLLKPAILLENKIFKLQLILYGMFILYTIIARRRRIFIKMVIILNFFQVFDE